MEIESIDKRPSHKAYKQFFPGMLLLTCLSSCAEFIEYPLDNEEVSLLAPLNKAELTDTLVHFWWETHEDAKFYRLQVVSGNFEQVTSHIIDTVVQGDKALLSIPDEGAYTWRLRPENHGSVGIYNYRTFEMKP